MSSLLGSRILLGVSGSVAAFKAAALASELTKSGADVRVILTAGAAKFVTAETFQGLTGNAVSRSLWRSDGVEAHDHLDLARWGQVMLVAPATANAIAKLALGLADDLLSTVALAFPGPMLIAPAMESGMWRHEATQAHVLTLRQRAVELVGPVEGHLASGSRGFGRMAEPADIVACLSKMLGQTLPKQDLQGVKFLVTAGATREPIDPVRFISNRSSGKMGVAVAKAAAKRGAVVRLVAAMTDAGLLDSLDAKIAVSEVETAEEMWDAVSSMLSGSDVLVMVAAVADFRTASPLDRKIKKSAGPTSLELTPTTDILAAANMHPVPGQIRVGFAAETENEVQNALEKLQRKGLDLVVANRIVPGEENVFGSETNEVTIVRANGAVQEITRTSKETIANRILDSIAELRAEKG
jgi:phosphopantothenoylcysteine decarboxylase/phosphopantothenate--cysteine ligase